MNNNIPNELAAALLADMEIKSQMQQMYLFQQEALAYITCHLHRQGVLDARAMARELIAGSSSIAKEIPGYDFSVLLAETFAGRIADIMGSSSAREDVAPLATE